MISMIVRFFKRHKVKHIGLAGLFGLAFAFVFERWLHTPIVVYIGLAVLFIAMVFWGNKVFAWCYKKCTEAPHYEVSVDYSNFSQHCLLLLNIKYFTQSNRRIKSVSGSFGYVSMGNAETYSLSKIYQSVSEKVKANSYIDINIPIIGINNESFSAEVMAASRMNREIMHVLLLDWIVHPVWLGISFPEDILYSEVINHSQLPI